MRTSETAESGDEHAKSTARDEQSPEVAEIVKDVAIGSYETGEKKAEARSQDNQGPSELRMYP